jgi:hypothetical protein
MPQLACFSAMTDGGPQPPREDGFQLDRLWVIATAAVLALLGFLLYEVWYYASQIEAVPSFSIRNPEDVPRR